jgi:gliding motility-associated-like protein
MKKINTLLALSLLPFMALAQPENDDCSGVVDLGEAPACPSTVFTNVDASPSDIGFGNIPLCFEGGAVGNDVWFAFTSSDTILDYTITVTGVDDGGIGTIENPQIALYRGNCSFNELSELDCVSAEDGSTEVALEIDGLTPNLTYFIRISDYSASASPNWGAFELCVEETPPDFTIDEGGSTDCTGKLLDTGGADGDYGNDEDFAFTICPDNPPECLIFTLDNYFIEPLPVGFGDQISFYEGTEATSNNLITSLDGFDFSDEGGGAVCYSVKANTGCMTVRFQSDASGTFQGFEGHWECSDECQDNPPITVNSNVGESEIIDFVATPVTTAEIASINCPGVSYGTFQGDDTELGLSKGLLLTSGSAEYAVGPNNSEGSNPLANNGAPGDADLDALSNVFGDSLASQNACVVELDVFVTAEELTFEYIFASEEYPEYVNGSFNDIFAFLISGPSINGDPVIGDQRNIAIIPGTDTPVQINSLNNLQNWEYYRNNENSLSVQYDGLTSGFMGNPKTLVARSPTIPCNTYRLKLAIADRGDEVFDSGVFISELRAGTPNLFVQFNSGIDYLVEECLDTPDDLVIELDEPSEDTTLYVTNVGGSATLGEDYLLEIPDTIVFLPGEEEKAFPITTLSDMEAESTEEITVALTNDFGCGEIVYTELTIELRDEINIDILSPEDTLAVCADSSRLVEVTGATTFFWSPVDVFNEPTSSAPFISTDSSQWVFVQGNTGPCSDTDSIFLEVIDPQIEITAQDPTAICEGDSVRLQVANNLMDNNLQWSPAAGLDNTDSSFVVAKPQESIEYTASVSIKGCTVQDTIPIDVSLFDVPAVTADTTICENFSVQLGEDLELDSLTTTYLWTPDTGLDNDTIPNPLASPASTTAYQLVSTSRDDFCSDTQEVQVTVLSADVSIDNPDTTEICLGTTVELTAQTTTGTTDGLRWSPDDGTLSDTTGLSVEATPEASQWYFATYTLGECTVVDSAYIRVDSLPAGPITADPEKDPYCQGETIVLSSPTYEPSNFPDIEHLWIPSEGQETPDSLWNMVLTAQDTFLYQRITTNRACIDTADILINVLEPPRAMISPQDTTICAGEPVSFTLTIDGPFDSFEWMGSGLSCTDCFDPTASPASGSYMVEIENMDCNSSVSATVNTVQPPDLLLNPNTTICEGNSLELNLATSPNTTYSWTSPNSTFTSDEPQPVVSPETNTTYRVVADNGQCAPVEGEIMVEVVPEAIISEITASDTILCSGEGVTLSVETEDLQEGDQLTWTGPNGLAVGQGASVDFVPENSGVYTLTYESAAGCPTQVRNLELELLPAPVADLASDTLICSGEPVQLNFVADPGTSYNWTSDDPGFSSTDALLTVNPEETTTYSLIADNEGPCPAIEADITVTVAPTPTLEIEGPNSICFGEEITLDAIVSDDIGEGTYNWESDNGQTFEGPSITVSPEFTTTYTLGYLSASECDSITQTFTVEVLNGVDLLELDLDPSGGQYLQGDVITVAASYNTEVNQGAIFTWVLNGDTVAVGDFEEAIDLELLNDGDMQPLNLTVVSPNGCTDSISINIDVDPIAVDIPNTFTPNGDDTNDFFNFVSNAPERVQVEEFVVYNRWGQQVYNSENPDQGWDGTFNGEPQPSEVYFYQIELLQPNGESLGTFQGDVTLLR